MTVSVLWLFLMVHGAWVGLQCLIMEFHDRTKLLFKAKTNILCVQWWIQRGFRGFTRTPLPAQRLKISYDNEIIWSHFHGIFRT